MQEIELDNRTNFATVTLRSAAPTVLQLVVHQCDRELDDLDWVITYIKADTLANLAAQTGLYARAVSKVSIHMCFQRNLAGKKHKLFMKGQSISL